MRNRLAARIALIRIATLLVLATGPLGAAPPEGKAEKDALHRVVIDMMRVNPDAVDIEATQRLGLLYLEGRLVPPDRIAGCGLLEQAVSAAVFSHPSEPERAAGAERVLSTHCGPGERELGNAWLNCWQFGQSYPVVFHLEPGFWIELDRQRARIQSPSGWFDGESGWPAGCYGQVVSIQRSSVSPPARSGKAARHFLEMLFWQSFGGRAHPVRELSWQLAEVTGTGMQGGAYERLISEPGSAWPSPKIPSTLRKGARLQMKPTGEVIYTISAPFKRTGTIE